MPVKMKPASTIKARLDIQRGGKAHKYFTNTCYKYMSQFVPGGTMSIMNQIVDLQVDSITYQHPGAHYLWTGKLYVDPKYKKGAFYSPDYGYWSRPGITKMPTNTDLKYHTPGTGSHWDSLMWTSKGDQVVQEVQEYVDGGCK